VAIKNYNNECLMTKHTDRSSIPAINAADFPLSFPYFTSGPIVISAYLGKRNKRRPAFGVVQAWRVDRDRYVILDQFRGRLKSKELEDVLNEYIEVCRPVAVLLAGTRGNQAFFAKIADRHPHVVHAIEWPDPDGAVAWLRALAEVIVGKRISIPADAPWRDVFVRQLCALPKSKSKALVRATMQFVVHAHYFAVPAKTERRFIAAGMAGYRAVVVDRQPGEGPGLGSDGREADKRSLTGPIFDIKTEVIY
jgi:hypothetical protein